MPNLRAVRLLVCLTIGVWGGDAIGAESIFDADRKAAKKFKPGDKVEVTRHGQKMKGTVLEIDTFGKVRVGTKDDPSGWSYNQADVRLLSKKAKAGAAAAGEPDPFKTDEEQYQEVGKRIWSDRSGKFKVEATLARIDGDNVVLKRADNKEVTVARARLSDDDQAVINKVSGTDEGTDPEDPEASEQESLGPEFELTETDLSSATPIDLGGSTQWKYIPDLSSTSIKPGRIALSGERNFFESVEALLLPRGSMAYLLLHNKPPAGKESRRVLAFDLAQRKLVNTGTFYSDQVPLDVSSDGKRLIARSDAFGFGNSGTLYLYSMEGFAAKPLRSWKPFSAEWHPHQDVHWAQFVGTDQVLTASNAGVLALWDVADGVRPIYSAKGSQGGTPILSPGGKYLIVRAEHGVSFLDARTGERVGYLEAPGSATNAAFALRPDGKRLALVDWGRIRVWNLETQELFRDFAVSGGILASTVAWADDERLITDRGDLVDVERRVRLWQYSGSESVAAVGDCIWAVAGGKPRGNTVLVGGKLPHGDALRLAEKVDPESSLVIRPGMEVALTLSFGGDREKVRQALTKRLEDVGMKVVSNSPIQLVASIKAGESQKMTYRRFGSQESSQHTVPTHIMDLSYVINGKPVWTYTNHSWAPHSLELKKGESIDQALARETKQDPRSFESVFVPGWVAQLPEGASSGKSPWPGT